MWSDVPGERPPVALAALTWESFEVEERLVSQGTWLDVAPGVGDDVFRMTF